MSKQYELYGGLPPHVHQDTSVAAAISILEHAENLRARIYRFIKRTDRHGATDDELEIASSQRHQTVSARRRELVLMNAIEDSGQRRQTRSGRNAIVWVAM